MKCSNIFQTDDDTVSCCGIADESGFENESEIDIQVAILQLGLSDFVTQLCRFKYFICIFMIQFV